MQTVSGERVSPATPRSDQVAKKKLIVVLGMHRSGTSALTRGLLALGVDLGDRLMPAVDGNNAKGFWEDQDIAEFDEASLAAIDLSWDALVSVAETDIERLRELGRVDEARQLLQSKMAGVNAYGLKDPRIAKLLALWKPIFEDGTYQTYYILALRNPLSVAKSLQSRDNFLYECSCWLWLDYVLASLKNADLARCLCTDFDDLMEDPRREFERIATFTGLSIDAREWHRYQSEFLERDLRHSTAGVDELRAHAGTPELVTSVYVAMRDWARAATAGVPALIRDSLPRWEAEFAATRAVRAVLDKLVRQAKEERERLESELVHQRAVNQLMAQSRSWRWSAAIRQASAMVRGVVARIAGR